MPTSRSQSGVYGASGIEMNGWPLFIQDTSKNEDDFDEQLKNAISACKGNGPGQGQQSGSVAMLSSQGRLPCSTVT